jgi:hypothetical protein
MNGGNGMPVYKRATIEFIVTLAIVIAAPVMVATQSGEANEPWDDMWRSDWPSMLEYDRPGLDPRTADLHQRAAASLARVSKSREMRLAADF